MNNSTHLETLMKTYLELAHVVPADCKTHRELKLEARIDFLTKRFEAIANGNVPTTDKHIKTYARQVIGTC